MSHDGFHWFLPVGDRERYHREQLAYREGWDDCEQRFRDVLDAMKLELAAAHAQREAILRHVLDAGLLAPLQPIVLKTGPQSDILGPQAGITPDSGATA